MDVDKALAVVRSMRTPKRVRWSHRAFQAFTYQPPPPKRQWTWETATPHERACFVRENRRLGVMDWDLIELFGLTRAGLAAIVRGKDWAPHHHDSGQPTGGPHG